MGSDSPLGRIHVVLNRPRYGGNIGSVARAVKNMGLGGLVIAGADDYMESEARMMAASAGDVLESARVCDSLEEAVLPYSVVLGVSRRVKSSRRRIMDPREAARFVIRELDNGKIALVFGPEDSGLSAVELGMCHGIVSIPAAADYPSLNLSQAVMVLAYELRMNLSESERKVRLFGGPSVDEFQSMLKQVESVLESTGFTINNPVTQVMVHLREILAGGVKTSQDARIVRGIFRRIAWALENGGTEGDDHEKKS
ncbi:tRNA (cytidine/uridine-2'-O-)-methyltransferase TrmJ [bacterium BMS3Abin14]|nr:tRNA (cytidine/uridine-2'-O-)-methyltransferase TrmJ [bacterium BMS3Abin14]